MYQIFKKILPNLAPDTIDGRAQCISNMLNNEAPKIRGRKIKQTASDKSSKEAASDSGSTSQHKETKTRGSLAIRQEKPDIAIQSPLPLHELDNTLTDPNDTINSTVTLSQMDATYDEDGDSDDSITLVKTVQKTQQKDNSESKTTKQKQKGQRRRKSKKQNDDQEVIKCTETCHGDSSSDSIRCNLCMDWFHATCVEIHNIDTIGAWVCCACRTLPHTVSVMKLQLENLLSTTTTIVDQIKSLSNQFERKMEQLDDRLTAFSNQQKRSHEACTDSLSEMHEDISILKTDVDKKTSSILSKSQTILEKIKGVPDLVSQSLKQSVNESNEEVIIVEDIAETNKQNAKHDKRNQFVLKHTNTRNAKKIHLNCIRKDKTTPPKQNRQISHSSQGHTY